MNTTEFSADADVALELGYDLATFSRFDKQTKTDLRDLVESRVRHRDFEIVGCKCDGCCAIRQRDYEERQRRLFVKALRGIRKPVESSGALTSSWNRRKA